MTAVEFVLCFLLAIGLIAQRLRIWGLENRVEALERQVDKILDLQEDEREDSTRLEGDEWERPSKPPTDSARR